MDFYDQNKELKPGAYKVALLALLNVGEDGLKNADKHNFFYVSSNNWKAFWEKEYNYLKNIKAETLKAAPDTSFNFTRSGFEKKYSSDAKIAEEMNRLEGAGNPKRQRSSSVTYAPGYQSKKEKKAKKMKL